MSRRNCAHIARGQLANSVVSHLGRISVKDGRRLGMAVAAAALIATGCGSGGQSASGYVVPPPASISSASANEMASLKPEVTKLAPASPRAGGILTVAGSHLGGIQRVELNGHPVFFLPSPDGSNLSVFLPMSASSGLLALIVENTTVYQAQLTVVPVPPTVGPTLSKPVPARSPSHKAPAKSTSSKTNAKSTSSKTKPAHKSVATKSKSAAKTHSKVHKGAGSTTTSTTTSTTAPAVSGTSTTTSTSTTSTTSTSTTSTTIGSCTTVPTSSTTAPSSTTTSTSTTSTSTSTSTSTTSSSTTSTTDPSSTASTTPTTVSPVVCV